MKDMKKVLWGICFWTALVTFTGYIALDTFVLTKSYNTNAVEMNTSIPISIIVFARKGKGGKIPVTEGGIWISNQVETDDFFCFDHR